MRMVLDWKTKEEKEEDEEKGEEEEKERFCSRRIQNTIQKEKLEEGRK